MSNFVKEICFETLPEKVIDRALKRIGEVTSPFDCRPISGCGIVYFHHNVYAVRNVILSLARPADRIAGQIFSSCRNVKCANPRHLHLESEISNFQKACLRFWLKVERSGESDCWNWSGNAFSKCGYGVFKGLGFNRAHRFSYHIHHPQDDMRGKVVCHRCDNPACVNPAHLWLGTVNDNNQDMVRKGRQVRGVRNGQSKLDPSKVRRLRKDREEGMSWVDLSTKYGVDPKTCRMTVSRQYWKHVE